VTPGNDVAPRIGARAFLDLGRRDVAWLLGLVVLAFAIRVAGPIFPDFLERPFGGAPVHAWGLSHPFNKGGCQPDVPVGPHGAPEKRCGFVFDEVYFPVDAAKDLRQPTLDYFDPATNERYVPYVIEPAAGATRSMMAFLLAAYDTDVVAGEERTLLRLHPRLAPYKVAVLPLSKKDTLTPLAREVLALLQPRFMCDYDETQNIGKRYRRQDEIGTPLCVTVDFDSLEDHQVTVRERDTTDQVRVPIDEVATHVGTRLGL